MKITKKQKMQLIDELAGEISKISHRIIKSGDEWSSPMLLLLQSCIILADGLNDTECEHTTPAKRKTTKKKQRRKAA